MTDTLYLIDVPPAFCPSCGATYVWQGYQREEFFNGCSQVCRCGAQFQYLPHGVMLHAAALNPHGDLRRDVPN